MKKEKIAEKFFYIVFAVWYVTEILFDTAFEEMLNSFLNSFFEITDANVNNIVSVMVFLSLVIIIVFFQHYQLKDITAFLLIALPLVFATLNSNHRVMMATMLFVMAAKHINLSRVVEISYIILLIMIPIIIGLCLIGVLQDHTMYRHEIIRHSLGFSHPNQLGLRVFQFVCCHYYNRRGRFFIRDTFYVLFAMLFVYIVPNSQTSFVGIAFVFVLMTLLFIKRNKESGRQYLGKMMIRIAVWANVISIVLSCIPIGRYPLLRAFNKMLSFRFSLCNKTMRYFGLSMLGTEVSSLVKDKYYVGIYHHFFLDNAYMSILLRYGIILFLIFTYIYISTMKYYGKIGDCTLVAILCAYAVYGIMETGYYSMSHNIFLVALAGCIFREYENEKEVTWGQKHRKVKLTW